MPDRKGRFLLYSDTSKHATGSALYQIQDGKPKLIAYASNRMPEAAKNYSITELEMCDLVINIASFSHLLKRVNFDAIVDHLTITHIMKSKMEPATNRIKRLLEVLSAYSFNLYYTKGKDMVLSDFLSRQQGDDSDPHQIIPISFNMKEILKQNYHSYVKDTFLVKLGSQNKAKGVQLPAIHGTMKPLVPHKIPENQPVKTRRREAKPIIINDTPTVIDLDTKPELDTQSQDTAVTQTQFPYDPTRPGIRQTPSYIHPITRPPPRPPDVVDNRRDSRPVSVTNPNLHFEENSPHQEGIISETYVSPDQSYIEEPQELVDLVDTSKLVQKYLPKQTDIDKILDVIKRKVLKGTHLHLTIKEIQAGYLSSPYFKDLYRFLAQNKLPSKKNAMHKVEILSEKVILLDSLLFKLVTTPDKEKALLAIPEVCADKIITLYHASLIAGHQGVTKTYVTISNKFFIPNLMHDLRSFLKRCHICQLARNDKPPTRQLQTRINLNYRPMSRLSMDLKVMPRPQKGH